MLGIQVSRAMGSAGAADQTGSDGGAVDDVRVLLAPLANDLDYCVGVSGIATDRTAVSASMSTSTSSPLSAP